MEFLLLHDGSVGQVGLDGCPLKQDYSNPMEPLVAFIGLWLPMVAYGCLRWSMGL